MRTPAEIVQATRSFETSITVGESSRLICRKVVAPGRGRLPWRVRAVGLSASCGVGPTSTADPRTNPVLVADHSIGR